MGSSFEIFCFQEENLDIIFSIYSTVTGRGLSFVSGRSKAVNSDKMANKAYNNPGIQDFTLAYKITFVHF